MGRKQHSVGAEVAHMRADIKGLSNEEIERLYGIKINENGTVIDEAEGEEYKNLLSWMQSYISTNIEEDEYDDAYRGSFDDADY